MSTGSVPPLFERLVDDAALFPPGNAPMDRALAEHAAARRAWYADLVGPFLCAADRVPEMTGRLPAEAAADPPLAVALVASEPGVLRDAGDLLAGDARFRLAHAEVLLGAEGDLRAGVGKLRAARPVGDLVVEVPRGPRTAAALRAVADVDRELTVKFRTGGTTATAYPSEEELATFLRAAIDLDLAVKLTAGLHHAVRRCDPQTGREQHGFLNVLAAVRGALLGAEVADLAELLAERDPAPLLDLLERMSEPDVAVVRSFFRSFGCCGVTDPLHDLVDLGLMRPPPFWDGGPTNTA